MAEDTISDLYSKYTSSVEEGIADDRYFQYLFEMVQAGDNTMEQTYRVLHKVVDEAWLSVVEDGLDAIFKIVDKLLFTTLNDASFFTLNGGVFA